MRPITTALTFSIFALGALLSSPAARAGQALDVKDIEAEADIEWYVMPNDDAPLKQLGIALTLRGPVAAQSTAHGDPAIDSILNDSGQPVTRVCFFPRNIHMQTIDRTFHRHPKDGILVRIDEYVSPPIKRLSELRGTIDLRTGGRIETMLLPNALGRPGGALDDESLKALGLVVRVQRRSSNPKQQAPVVSNGSSPTAPAVPATASPLCDPVSPPRPSSGATLLPFAMDLKGMDEMKERWVITIEREQSEAEITSSVAPSGSIPVPAHDSTSPDGESGASTVAPTHRATETPASPKCEVVECSLVDSRGKTLNWRISGRSGSGDLILMELGYDRQLPDDAQLKLVMHLDSEIVSVPFALKDIPVPPQRGGSGPGPVVTMPKRPFGRLTPLRRLTPDTAAPITPNISTDSDGKPSLSSALKNALGASLGLTDSSGTIVLSPDTKPRTPPRAPRELHVDRKSGACELVSRDELDSTVEVEVGIKLKGTCRFYLSDFFDKQIISAPIFLRNKSTETMHCYYYVAFFDKEGRLLGCASQGAELAGGDQTQLGSCLIFLPDGARERAVSYQVVYYESDMPIGTPGEPVGAGAAAEQP